MNNTKKFSIDSLFSNPIFLLLAVIFIFAVLFYLFGSKGGGNVSDAVSTYKEDQNWAQAEDAKGAPDAKVTIVEYGDYQCPACAAASGIVDQILEEYSGKVRLVYRHFPLPQHAFSFKAAISAECAGEQGKFWDMHKALYADQRGINSDNLKYAEKVGLDIAKYTECIKNSGYSDKIKKDIAQGENDKLSFTPTFIVNGKRLDSFSAESFRTAINAELAK